MLSKKEFYHHFETASALNQKLINNVQNIIENVRVHQDEALFQYNQQFDNVELSTLEISQTDIDNSLDKISSELRDALKESYENIKSFQERIKHENVIGKNTSLIYNPLESVGIYVPGGKAAYPSTVLMTATLAEAAGVENIIVVTPPQPEGVAPSILAACKIAGVNRVFQVGGAQSIAALAFGTETIPKVDKIVGPGNQFVATAKQLLYGQVGIDQIAGPSEIMIIADETSEPEFIVQDILAQAEHDENARTFLLSTSKVLLEKVEALLPEAINKAPRKAIIEPSIQNFHYAILTKDNEENIEIANFVAPEHLSIQSSNPEQYIHKIKYAGAMFLGPYAPEALGDYNAGPSHVLPTNQTSRFTNGLTVNDFLTSHSVISYNKSTFNQLAEGAMEIAHTEGLYQHEESVRVRVNKVVQEE
ncbi:histidinol dehydrogenase [Staphylococcus carnosus]|uniref:Histidinol dehydrogenase n=2 Tax=Staphylococcus carnosus TaxID=1281 RepID=B9DQ88_STACT|nr:histidinol dehydrogenase [Staphylococcus carnosus]ANZ33761.1 histidinol dehydrogenase [Staphylococcus carnosus]KKB24871.1 histidinol dehydrogenase [Staphylococcus carnosus]KOR13999.1 histidinol dehydrogenase [Staphylococcus carnosus]POA01848.1 histidinol dehydrogenase [Staphylococcus carnosus]QPT03718.1 histidinol dehydrogenase [Staphylococcus carnosus]